VCFLGVLGRGLALEELDRLLASCDLRPQIAASLSELEESVSEWREPDAAKIEVRHLSRNEPDRGHVLETTSLAAALPLADHLDELRHELLRIKLREAVDRIELHLPNA